MKRQVTSILLFSALLVGGASTFVSCKDTESDALYDSNGKIAEVIAKQAKDISDLADKLAKETTDRKDADQVFTDFINGKAVQIKETADKAWAQAQENQTKIGELTTKISGLQTQLGNLLVLAGKVDGLEGKVSELESKFESFKSCTCDFTALENKYDQLKNQQDLDRARIDAIERGKTTLDEELGRINTTLDGKVDQTTFDDLKDQVERNQNTVDAYKEQVENLRNTFANYVEKSYLTEHYYTKVDVDNAITDAITNASTALKTQITDLETKLTTQLNSLFNAMANEVTGIVVNRFYSPILGSYKDMMGTEARFLGAYYGYAEDYAMIGNKEINPDPDYPLLDDAKDNAGSIGVYINPANKDFSGLTFKIVDSQGNVTPFIATATKNDKVEHYGYTRAGEVSTTPNYYLLKVSIDPNRLDEVKNWTSSDVESLKGVAQNILNKLKDRSNNLNLTEIANTLYKTFNNRLTEYHLALEQELTDGTNKSLNVTIADKDFAATVIKPLSYKFLSGGINYDIKDIPTLESKGLYIDTSSLKWKDLNHIADINQTVEVDVPDASTMTINGDKVHIDASGDLQWADPNNKNNIEDLQGVTVTVNKITFYADAVKYNNKKQAVTVTVSMAEFNKIIDQVNSQVGNMLGTVENLANKVNKFESAIDGNFINRVNNFIHKCNYYLDNANKFLQPTMFATDGNNWVKLPTIANGATYVKMTNGKANVLLLPTSYTLEYIAPAYKKYITVEDPDGATVTGENIGKVISGNIHKAGFTATKEGVYTIYYDAVDYTGGLANTKFFIKVVK